PRRRDPPAGPVGRRRAGRRPLRLLQPVQRGQAEHPARPQAARGRAVLRGLLERADVVIDNMRAGALDRMGFSYDELRALNPRLVAVSMTGLGEDGPARD